MALYQCLLLGAPTDDQAAAFVTTFDECLALFGLQRGRDYTVDRGITEDFSDTTATVAVFFGAEGAEYPEATRLIRLKVHADLCHRGVAPRAFGGIATAYVGKG